MKLKLNEVELRFLYLMVNSVYLPKGCLKLNGVHVGDDTLYTIKNKIKKKLDRNQNVV